MALRSFDDLWRLLINRLGIQEAAIAIMRTKNKLPRFRDALTFSALFLVLPRGISSPRGRSLPAFSSCAAGGAAH